MARVPAMRVLRAELCRAAVNAARDAAIGSKPLRSTRMYVCPGSLALPS